MRFEVCESRLALDGAGAGFASAFCGDISFSGLESTQGTAGGITFTFATNGLSPSLFLDSNAVTVRSDSPTEFSFWGTGFNGLFFLTDATGRHFNGEDRDGDSGLNLQSLLVAEPIVRIEHPPLAAPGPAAAESTPEIVSLATLLAAVPNSDLPSNERPLADNLASRANPPSQRVATKSLPKITAQGAIAAPPSTDRLSPQVDSLARAWAFEIAASESLDHEAMPVVGEPEHAPRVELLDHSTSNDPSSDRWPWLRSGVNEKPPSKKAEVASLPADSLSAVKTADELQVAVQAEVFASPGFSSLDFFSPGTPSPWTSSSSVLTAGTLALLAIERVRLSSNNSHQAQVTKLNLKLPRTNLTADRD